MNCTEWRVIFLQFVNSSSFSIFPFSFCRIHSIFNLMMFWRYDCHLLQIKCKIKFNSWFLIQFNVFFLWFLSGKKETPSGNEETMFRLPVCCLLFRIAMENVTILRSCTVYTVYRVFFFIYISCLVSNSVARCKLKLLQISSH